MTRKLKFDLVGKKFGKLTAIEHITAKKQWRCICDCGNEYFARSELLRDGTTTHCGCNQSTKLDLTGHRYGRLFIKEWSQEKDKWLAQCDCGNILYVTTTALRNKKKGTKSCGCLKGEYWKTHDRPEKGKPSLNRKDYTGMVFGRLTALNFEYVKDYRTFWKYQCECGNTGVYKTHNVISGKKKSCGCLATEAKIKNGKGNIKRFLQRNKEMEDKTRENIGKQFGELTILDMYIKLFDGYRTQIAKTKCSCGTIKDIRWSSLRSGRVQTCGCREGLQNGMLTTEQFIKDSIEMHGNLYDYSLVDYKGVNVNVDIICSEHGVFSKNPGSHKQGQGCPVCSRDIKGEREISEFLTSLGVKHQRNIRGLLPGRFEADIVVHDKKIVIEYDGLIWHSEKYNENLYNIKNKTDLCNSIGYRCIHIREDLYLDNPDKILSLIKSALGLFDNKIGARETVKKDISTEEYKELCVDHLQGFRGAKYKKGLFYKGQLVACIGYSVSGELVRYVVKNNWLIQGALPKLLKNENVLYSFCDLSFFTGASYLKSGFELDYITKPNYVYIRHQTVRSRQQMMKHKLHKILDDFDPGLTEVENCNNNGWYRLFDAGSSKFKRLGELSESNQQRNGGRDIKTGH